MAFVLRLGYTTRTPHTPVQANPLEYQHLKHIVRLCLTLHVLSSLIGESLCGAFRVHKVRHQAVFVSANHCMYTGGRPI